MSFSRALSTARFVSEVNKTLDRWSLLICCQINSAMTVVLPVPGGPWRRHRSWALRAWRTASFCDSFRDKMDEESNCRNSCRSWIVISMKSCVGAAFDESKIKSFIFGFTGRVLGSHFSPAFNLSIACWSHSILASSPRRFAWFGCILNIGILNSSFY